MGLRVAETHSTPGTPARIGSSSKTERLMRRNLLLAALGCATLGGCIRSVAIPVQEAALKEACYGKDQPMAGVAGYSVWRCGQGDQAKYGIYQNGTLVREANELEASQAAAGFACIGRGLKAGSPEYNACVQSVGSAALSATATLRAQENSEAELRRRQALAALGEAGAAMSAAAASQPQTVRVQTNCTTTRTGMFVNTNCF